MACRCAVDAPFCRGSLGSSSFVFVVCSGSVVFVYLKSTQEKPFDRRELYSSNMLLIFVYFCALLFFSANLTRPTCISFSRRGGMHLIA